MAKKKTVKQKAIEATKKAKKKVKDAMKPVKPAKNPRTMGSMPTKSKK